MINGIGVVGWGVGGIEGEAAMLGQPVYLLTPDVVGFEFTGRLREGVTATDLVLTVTEILRREKVVGSFVEFFGEGTAGLAVPDRATLGNMAPEYGATMGFFPVDGKTIDYFKGTGRSVEEIEALQAYFEAQEMFGVPLRGADRLHAGRHASTSARSSPSLSGPRRPQDRIELGNVKTQFTSLLQQAPGATTASTSRPNSLLTRHLVRAAEVRAEPPQAHPAPHTPSVPPGRAAPVEEMDANKPTLRGRAGRRQLRAAGHAAT